MQKIKPFTYEEILKEKDNFPSRGIYCPKCKSNIPVFADLSVSDENEIRSLGNENFLEQIRIIREKTGCGVRWAKIWAVHPNGPQKVVFEGDSNCP